MKRLLKERLQQLAGIKPLYENKSLLEIIGKSHIEDWLSDLVDDRQEVDGSNRSDLIGIALPGIELTTIKNENIEELISNLFILKDNYKLDQGIPLERQPEEVQKAVEYLNSKEAIEALNKITDIEEAMNAAMKAGADTIGGSTEKIYTADAFPNGMRNSQFYKDAIEDGWKFINKLYLNGRNAKNMPVGKDGFALNEYGEEDRFNQDTKTVSSLANKFLEISKGLRRGEYKGLQTGEINEIDDLLVMVLQAAMDGNITALIIRLENMIGKTIEKEKPSTPEEDDRPDNWKELPGYNPDHFYGDDSFMKKSKSFDDPVI